MAQPWYYIGDTRSELPNFCFGFADKEETKIKIRTKHCIQGDFCWNESGNEALVRTVAAEKLLKVIPDVEFSTVDIVQSAVATRRKNPISFDYLMLKISIVVDHNDKLTTYRMEQGHKTFDGTESEKWNADINKYVTTPRIKGRGVFVEKDKLQGKNVFSLSRLPDAYCVTELFRSTVLAMGLSNISFQEFGDLME
jgi:hypothetical protein